MKNIFYFKKINKIGGTEQFLYEIGKKYCDHDITVYYDIADIEQLKRLKKLVRCRQRKEGEKVHCEKAFFNFNIDMIDDVEAKEYTFVSHANYEELHNAHGGYIPPITHPKLNRFVGVSQFAADKLQEYADRIGLKIKVEKCYNPLTIEEKKKVITIVSACRLDDKVKGGKRTLKLIEALDRYCYEHNRNYLWLIFTNKNTNVKINSPNVVLMQPRLDVRQYIANADYVAQLSNDMETFCYTTNEAWSYGVPCITTPLTINKELPITNNELIELDWDCRNVDEVARQIFEKEVKPFKYEAPADSWVDILEKGESNYKEELIMKKVKAIRMFDDVQENIRRKANEEFIVDDDRADYLLRRGLVQQLEYIEPVIEKAVKEEPKETTKKVRKNAKK